MDEKICDIKHKEIDEKIGIVNKRLDTHSQEIDSLKVSDAVNTNQIDKLTKSLDGQTKAIWGLVITVATSLIGALGSFFIWFVQTH